MGFSWSEVLYPQIGKWHLGSDEGKMTVCKLIGTKSCRT